jgi:hypothetical protein
VSSVCLAKALEPFLLDAMRCVGMNHGEHQNCWWGVPFRRKKHDNSLQNERNRHNARKERIRLGQVALYSTGIRPISYSYRGIYRGRFTYPPLLLHLFTPPQLYSMNYSRGIQ